MATTKVVFLDGESLSPETLHRLSLGCADVGLSPEAWTRVDAGRCVIDGILESGEIAYGINTGKCSVFRCRKRMLLQLTSVKYRPRQLLLPLRYG